jgi:hypothetical protein
LAPPPLEAAGRPKLLALPGEDATEHYIRQGRQLNSRIPEPSTVRVGMTYVRHTSSRRPSNSHVDCDGVDANAEHVIGSGMP